MIGFGWEAFKKRKQFFIGIAALWFLIQFAISIVTDQFPQAPEDGAALWLLGVLISGGVSAAVVNNMGLIAFSLKAHDAPEAATASLLWHPHPFWKYVGAAVLQSAIILAGLFLINVLGALALLVGLLVSVPVSYLAAVHAYRALSASVSVDRTA